MSDATTEPAAADAPGKLIALPVAKKARARGMTGREMVMNLAYLAAAVGLVLHGERDVGSMLITFLVGGHAVGVGTAKRN